MHDPVGLFQAAAQRSGTVMAGVGATKLSAPTPCEEWSVQQLMDHMAGGPAYLLAASQGGAPAPVQGVTADDYRKRVDEVLAALTYPAVLARTCVSPLGFEWTVAEAVAGTFMDTLVHTWDLAVATGQDSTLDPALVQACVMMFLPDMPAHGRAAGLVGPAVPVPPDAPAQDRLLGAMGRRP
ncbi:TIGR03086 family metal-binding protein [Pseudonocardia sp. CA-142604]|uniref:TIGR03086 family metal-binding protein n=1 Tax=Pseudonocardia sp. CA-142604 TaxID=3240024 RepID=UPI003D8F5501